MGLVDYDTDSESEDSWKRTPGEVNAGETITIGGVTRKVLSMEKAMQREHSFKKKLEALQKKKQNVLQKPSTSTQAPTTKRELSYHKSEVAPKQYQNVRVPQKPSTGIEAPSTKRELSYRKSEVAPKQYQNVPQMPSTGIEGITANTRNSAVQGNMPPANVSCPLPKHAGDSYFQRTPEKREQGVAKMGVKRKDPPPNLSCSSPQHAGELYLQHTPERCENTKYKCKECDIICSGLVNLNDHYLGNMQLVYNTENSHERNAGVNLRTKLVCVQQDSERSESGIYKCEECDLICSGFLNFQQHLKGKKHKAKMEQLRVKKDGDMSSMSGTEPMTCSICKVLCMGEYNYREHLAGKKHAACLQAIQG